MRIRTIAVTALVVFVMVSIAIPVYQDYVVKETHTSLGSMAIDDALSLGTQGFEEIQLPGPVVLRPGEHDERGSAYSEWNDAATPILEVIDGQTLLIESYKQLLKLCSANFEWRTIPATGDVLTVVAAQQEYLNQLGEAFITDDNCKAFVPR